MASGPTCFINIDITAFIVFFSFLANVLPGQICPQTIDFPAVVADEKDEVLGGEITGRPQVGEQSSSSDNLNYLSSYDILYQAHSLWQRVLHFSENKHLDVNRSAALD